MTPYPPLSKLPDFAALAKRISAWTTNSLLTMMVLAAGIGFGRQVLQWWAADLSPAQRIPATALPADPLGDSTQSHVVQFGSHPWSLCRQIVTGDKDSALRRLRAVCREVLRATRPGGDLPLLEDGNLLALLAASTPVDQEPGRWQLYARHEAFPVAVGIVQSPANPVTTRSKLGEAAHAVTLWAAAVPTGPEQWTLWSFQPERTSGVESGVIDTIPLPPETRKTLSLTVAEDGETVAFSGPDRCEKWRHFYDGWFSQNGWRPLPDWQTVGGAWNATYLSPDHRGSVYLRVSPDGRGGCDGFVMTIP